jgi:hypothetical protein
MREEQEKAKSPVALKIAIGTGIALGAVVSGLLISRRGRNLVKEAMQGRSRTRLEDRALDAMWGDRALGRREVEVEEVEAGVLELSGVLRSEAERQRALEMVENIKGVQDVIDSFDVNPGNGRRRRINLRP